METTTGQYRTTKTFIFEKDGEFIVSCRIECPSQPYQWIDRENQLRYINIRDKEKFFSGDTPITLTGTDLSVGYMDEVSFDRIPYLADGGLAYGQTLANVGEYAGASANPEVIAPLSDLITIIGNTNDNSEQISLLKQQNELLTRLLNKNTDIKVDGRTLASTVKSYDRKLGTEIIYSK